MITAYEDSFLNYKSTLLFIRTLIYSWWTNTSLSKTGNSKIVILHIVIIQYSYCT